MVDLHSHILYGVDDGAKTLEDSTKIIDEAIENGITDIFLTSHYILESDYIANSETKRKILTKLKNKYKNKINLHLGTEIYINNQIDELVQANEIATLASSKYLLIELPVWNEYPSLAKYLFQLQSKGYRIIIAHPERYQYFRNDFNKVLNLCKQGILFQGNYMSLFDTYGPHAKKMFEKMIQHQCYSFMASDVHRSETKFYTKINKAYQKVSKLTSKEYADKIFKTNGLKILENQKIESDYQEKISFFNRIRGKI